MLPTCCTPSERTRSPFPDVNERKAREVVVEVLGGHVPEPLQPAVQPAVEGVDVLDVVELPYDPDSPGEVHRDALSTPFAVAGLPPRVRAIDPHITIEPQALMGGDENRNELLAFFVYAGSR